VSRFRERIDQIRAALSIETRLVFRPARADREWLDKPDPDIQDMTVPTLGGRLVHMWWLPGDPAAGAVLLCHGNGGNLSHRGRKLVSLRAALGCGALVFDYPGYGKTNGRPTERGCYAAGDAAFDWLTGKAGVAAEGVVLYGESLGGGVAVELARRREHRSLVLIKTFTSVPDVARLTVPRWVPVNWIIRNRFDNLAKIKACRRPVVVAHGTTDEVVPYAHGEQLYEAANGPKLFFPMPGVSHNEPMPATFLDTLGAFLARETPLPQPGGA
jgi:fermentation-respiration switch protein FrsA (DUF1100 family)